MNNNHTPFYTLLLFLIASFISVHTWAACEPPEYPVGTFPYPNDFYTTPDDSSPTGLRLNLCDALVSEQAINGYGGDWFIPKFDPQFEHFRPSSLGAYASGFSVANAVLFPIRGVTPPQAERLYFSPGSSVFAYDITAGEKVPIEVYLDHFYNKKRRSNDKFVQRYMRVEARSKWKPGHQYAVFYTQQINKDVEVPTFFGPDRGAIDISAQYSDAINGRNSRLADLYFPALLRLWQEGFDPNQILDFTVFTVRDHAEVHAPVSNALSYLNNWNIQDPVVFRDDQSWLANPANFPHFSRVAEAEITMPNFIGENGEFLMLLGGDPRNNQNWNQENVKIKLWVPISQESNGHQKKYSTMIYLHGIGENRDSAYLQKLAQYNALQGVATLSFDLIGFGDRSEYKSLPVDTLGFQTLANLGYLNRALQVTENSGFLPHIDTDNLYLTTTSLGTAYAGAYAAIGPNIQGAFMQVGGGKLSHVWHFQAHWNNFPTILQTNEFQNPYLAIRSNEILQLSYDFIDVINYSDYFLQSSNAHIAASSPRPLGMLNAGFWQDTKVPTHSSRALAEAAYLVQYNSSPNGEHPYAAKQENIIALQENYAPAGYAYTEVNAVGCNWFGYNCGNELIGHGIYSHNFETYDSGHATRRQWLRDVGACEGGRYLCDTNWDEEAGYIVP